MGYCLSGPVTHGGFYRAMVRIFCSTIQHSETVTLISVAAAFRNHVTLWLAGLLVGVLLGAFAAAQQHAVLWYAGAGLPGLGLLRRLLLACAAVYPSAHGVLPVGLYITARTIVLA